MIDVNKITSTLAKLPDAQLQQYAQMHKSDPYIMALAMTESNRRKEMRSAGQGAQGVQEMPKVVDQAVAEMAPQQLPEEMGIGRLNAGNMNFAGGGIVAFAGGGDVERYNGTQGSLTGEARSPFAFLNPADILGGLYGGARRIFSEGIDAEAAAKRRAAEELLAQENISGMDRRFMAPRGVATLPMAANAQPAVLPTASDAAPKVDTTQRGTGAAPAAASLPSLTDLAKLRQSIYDKQDFKDPAAAQLKELEARERASAEEGLAALKRDQSKFEDAFKGREARLTAREGDIGKQKDTNTGLAFLNAGLAIMSTPGGLATAIGKGAQVGTAQYAAGLDKIRSAQERLDDARDKMEELKLNRAEMSAKEIRAAEKDIRNTGVDAQKRAIDGIRMAADVNEKRATDIFGKSVELSKTVYEQQQQNARSAAQIAATKDTPERVVWNQLLAANNNDAVKATAEFQKIKSEKFNVLQSYADYLKGFAGKETITPPMAFDQYAAQFSVPTVKAPGKGATVLKQP